MGISFTVAPTLATRNSQLTSPRRHPILRFVAGALTGWVMSAMLTGHVLAADQPSLSPSPSATPLAEPPAPGATPADIETPPPIAPVPEVTYGIAARARWLSTPGWLLGLFLEQKVPLSSWGTGFEVFRRKGNLDITGGFTFSKIGPPDGNWLGKGKNPSLDTDFISFRNFNLIGLDVAFIWTEQFNDYFGLRYGAGLGLGIVTGKMLRISDSPTVCNASNAGDPNQCYPIKNGQRVQGEAALAATEGGVDTPQDPHRFKDTNVPGAIPIVNLTLGLNVRIPEVKGFEVRPLELGFYGVAFFVGGSVAYVF